MLNGNGMNFNETNEHSFESFWMLIKRAQKGPVVPWKSSRNESFMDISEEITF